MIFASGPQERCFIFIATGAKVFVLTNQVHIDEVHYSKILLTFIVKLYWQLSWTLHSIFSVIILLLM